MSEEKTNVFDRMVEGWPAPIFAREEADRFTGGMIRSKHLANLDSLGAGPPRIKIGRKVGYPTKEFCEWLKKRVAA